jgi:hypothetical protein
MTTQDTCSPLYYYNAQTDNNGLVCQLYGLTHITDIPLRLYFERGIWPGLGWGCSDVGHDEDPMGST